MAASGRRLAPARCRRRSIWRRCDSWQRADRAARGSRTDAALSELKAHAAARRPAAAARSAQGAARRHQERPTRWIAAGFRRTRRCCSWSSTIHGSPGCARCPSSSSASTWRCSPTRRRPTPTASCCSSRSSVCCRRRRGIEPFAQRYYEALQRQPAVIIAHGDVRRILKQAK